MSYNVNWDTDKYKEDHESEEQWKLRRAFMERWKGDYPEERLVCLARVFTNMEFMGCRYPAEIMQEVAGLSHEVAKEYRNFKKSKLQRTFVSASDAAEDRAKGIKREGGVVKERPQSKSAKITFVPQGHLEKNEEEIVLSDSDDNEDKAINDTNEINSQIDTQNSTERKEDKKSSEMLDVNNYLEEMLNVKCIDPRNFKESMFQTEFGRMVLLVRQWVSKLGNIQVSCHACKMPLSSTYENGCFSLTINGKLVARASGSSKAEARCNVELMAWNRLKQEMIVLLVKELWIAHGDSHISVSDVTGKAKYQFGVPVENKVALKMMKLMGWKGGGLGADAQGIAEPIKPNLQMVNRAGLGSGPNLRQLTRAGVELMKRFAASDALDLDLVFSAEFNKDERAALHQAAGKIGLLSRSYGANDDRFLVVRKKFNPFNLVRAVLEKGGSTPKYQVFIPHNLGHNRR